MMGLVGGAAWRGLAILAASLLVVAAAPAPPADSIGAIVKDYETFTRRSDVLTAGLLGDKEALKRWPDDSPAAVRARQTELAAFCERLRALAAQPLAGEDALNRDILNERLERALAAVPFDEERIPFTSGEGFYTLPEGIAATTGLRSEEDADAWIARLNAIPDYYATETANMRRGLATHFVQPRITVEEAIRDLRSSIDSAPAASPLLKPFDTLPASFPPERKAALKAEAVSIVATKVKPAQRALADFFERDYLPHARLGIGLLNVPNGRAYYAHLVRRHTTTSLTPDQVHAIGLAEVARIRGEMEKAKQEAGFSGSLAQFLAFLRTDPRFYAKSAFEYGEKAREIAKRADAKLPRFFGLLPRLTYGVGPAPEGLESGSAGYVQGNPRQGVAGMVMFKSSLATQSPLYGLPAWLLHEGVPGHHIQIAIAQERTDLPGFRRQGRINAFQEGWALYAETLGDEMGLYQDAYERFGRLSLDMWRACRLVMDTGIHWMGWTRDQALACLRENSALSPAEMEREVDRYIAWPGQALAYKIGELKFLELRRHAEKALGPRFDIRRFHDLVLDEGAMPLSLLEARVDAWIAQQAKESGRP